MSFAVVTGCATSAATRCCRWRQMHQARRTQPHFIMTGNVARCCVPLLPLDRCAALAHHLPCRRPSRPVWARRRHAVGSGRPACTPGGGAGGSHYESPTCYTSSIVQRQRRLAQVAPLEYASMWVPMPSLALPLPHAPALCLFQPHTCGRQRSTLWSLHHPDSWRGHILWTTGSIAQTVT